MILDQKKNGSIYKLKNEFWKYCKAYNLYRVIKMTTLKQL